jgi:glycosyltransferase involved in cell wall biosynthesis
MKILQVNNNHFVKGGSDKVFFETSRLLEEAGHDTVPYCAVHPKNLDSPHDRFFPSAADTEHRSRGDLIRYLYNQDAARGLKQLLASERNIDLAHLHIYHGKLTSSILGPLKENDIPVVQTLHEYKLACPVYTMLRHGVPCSKCVSGSTLNSIIHRCKDASLMHSLAALTEYWVSRLGGDVRRVDRFICISEFQRQVMLSAGIPSEKLVVVHNFVDTRAYSPVRPELKQDHLLYFGRIEELKGIGTLLEAVGRTGQRLVIAGHGTWEEGMKKCLSGRSNIDFVGFRSGPELGDLVARASAVVVPSEWYEPFGLTVIEAKASGTPVVASKMGGIPELVRPGIDGFLFEAGDPGSLADALESVAASDQMQLGANAREDAETRFSPAAHLEALLSVYREVLVEGS